jgi:hypothetical protein
MGIGRVLGAAAPIAAGYFLPGSATLFGSQLGAQIAAGAATGAGIAALSGEDVLGGAVTGGLGGMSGGSFAGAAEGAKAAAQGQLTDAAANQLVTKQAIQQAGQVVPSGITGTTGQLGANLGQVNTAAGTTYTAGGGSGLTGGTINQAYRPDFMATTSANMPVREAAFGTDYGIKDIAGQLGKNAETGELNPVLGAGKMGLAGLGVAGGAGAFDVEPVDIGPRDEERYDPNRRLNLNMDTGISKYLGDRDTGLRLLAQGGEVQRYNNGGMAMYGMTPAAPPPKYGIIDVGGKFVETSKTPGPGLISDSQYQQDYGDTTAGDNKKQEGSSGFDSDLAGSAGDKGDKEMKAGAIQALAQGFARQQTSSPNESVRLGLESLAAGGYLETGGEVGDGMSDEIEATIEGTQKARLSDGEFVIPADIVSHLGNGSSDAGAKRLYEMMDKVRTARTGNKQQGKEIKPERYMPR